VKCYSTKKTYKHPVESAKVDFWNNVPDNAISLNYNKNSIFKAYAFFSQDLYSHMRI